MKNTKKILMIFCSLAVLVATVFSLAITAIAAGTAGLTDSSVTAGKGTPITEYANMKISVSHGFEDGTYKTLFGGLPNGATIPANGGVYTQNNGLRQAVKSVYGNDNSIKYFVINYDTNKGAADVYIQPKIGFLDDVEKTPVNGFISEFDISFMNAVEVLKEQAVDENGELVWETLGVDDEGNPIYAQALDEKGNPLWETSGTDAEGNPIYVQATDNEGNPLWELDADGNQVLDENEQPIPVKVPVKVPVMKNVQEPLLSDEIELDEDGNPVYEVDYQVPMVDDNGNPVYEVDADGNRIQVFVDVYKRDSEGRPIVKYKPVVDANGEIVMVDKVVEKTWTGLSKNFGIGMYNTHTYKDGKVDLLSFSTNTTNTGAEVVLNAISGNLLENAPTFTMGRNEWCHITVQFDAKTLLTYVYVGRDDSEFDTNGDGVVDYCGRLLVGIKRATYVIEDGSTVNVYPLQFRLGCTSTSGVVAFDNFIGYQGTTIHDPTVLNSKVAYEKYLYLADILENTTEYKTVKDTDGNTVYQVLTDADGNTLYLPAYETKLNENGELVYVLDDDGNKIPLYETDAFGKKVPVYVQAYEYATDENGNVIYEILTDAKGNPVYEVETDVAGNTIYVTKKDDNGNVIYEYAKDVDGETILYRIKKDANGEPMYEKNDDGSYVTDKYGIKTPIYETDASGNKIPLYALDANGNKIPVYETDEKGNKIPVYKTDADGNKVPVYKTDENGDKIPVYKTDADGNKILAFETDFKGNKIPVYEKAYLLDTLGKKVPVYETDEDGNKIVVKVGESSVNRYQAFNLLATDDELRKVYSGEDLGGEPGVDEALALEHAIALYEAYANDKKNNTGSTDTLVSCYYEMLNDAKLENAAAYLSYAEDALNTERTIDNYADRAAKVAKAREFYNSVGSIILRDSNGDYGKAVAILDQLEAIVKSDEAAKKFVNAVNIYKNSVAYGATAARIKAHYDNASYYYPNISSDYLDPETNLADDSVQKIKAAVATYLAAADVVTGSITDYNTARFAGILSIIEKKTTGNWADDGADVEELWLRALDIILAGDFNANDGDFAAAKVLFDSANSYFWNKLQKNHVSIISTKLDSYNDPDMTYIDKAGICTFVDRYIEANAKYLDLDSIEITRELSRNEAYKVQLNTLVGDYKKLLTENAPRFISVMKMSKHYSTYADLKPLYDEATKYYYTMNIEGEGIEECLADYEELRTLITSIERDSQAYIDIIYGNVTDENGNAIFKAMSTITDKSELYDSLREAYLCYENLDITYPGAKEAKAIYDAKYQEYNSGASVVNTEIANGETVVYAARGNWTFDIIVVFAKKLINAN